MAEFKVAVGEEFFDELRRNGCYYVDKTELLYKIAADGKTRVTLFNRPRRFGKTLTMSMFQSFFDITGESKDVFEGLAVTKNEEFCKEWMNQYPVLFISLKDVAGLDFDSAYAALRSTISEICIRHAYLADSEKVDEADRTVFLSLKSQNVGSASIKSALRTLTRMMYAYYGKPVIVLIDEYDVPLAKANDAEKDAPGYYEKMLDVIRGLMSSSLKTNDYLKFAVITGCLRIAKESIFTGVNHFKTYSILDRKYSDAFGFTEKEVERMLKAAGLSGRMGVVKSWYDGYVFGNSEIFCPWDVVNFVADSGDDPELDPDNYWKDTSENDVIKAFIDNPEFHVSKKFEALMNGGTILQTITDKLTYGNLSQKEDNLWSVLFMTGYLTKADKSEKGKTVHLRIPNAEIASIFQESVVDYFNESMDRNVLRELMAALWGEQEETASRLISDLLWSTISYNNYHENYYHAFVTGILAGQSYEVESDQENGLGRTDIVVTDRKNRRAIIIEAKKADSEKDLEQACMEGKQQIIDKQYARGLNGYTKIICYGMAFFQKTALVRKLDL